MEKWVTVTGQQEYLHGWRGGTTGFYNCPDWIFFPPVIIVICAGVHKKRHFGDQGAKTPQIHFAGMLQEETGILLLIIVLS